MSEITTDVLIIGASLAGAAAAKRTVDAGFQTITIEKKTLPRHKICSGILSPRGYAFLRENFGEPPDNAFHAPKWITGVNFLFPSGLQLPMPFIPGPTPHIYRKFADHHVVKESRTEVHERTEFRDIETGAKDVAREGAPRRQRRGDRLPGEVRHRRRRPAFRGCRASCTLPSATASPGSSSARSTTRRTSTSTRSGSTSRSTRSSATTRGPTPKTAATSSATPTSTASRGRRGTRRAIEYFEKHHGLRIHEEVSKEGCLENFGMSLTNHFVFGERRVLVTGQAAGFLNMMAEGMSCAMHSGAIAGESIVESFTRNRDANAVYDDLIQSERTAHRRSVEPAQDPLRQPS